MYHDVLMEQLPSDSWSSILDFFWWYKVRITLTDCPHILPSWYCALLNIPQCSLGLGCHFNIVVHYDNWTLAFWQQSINTWSIEFCKPRILTAVSGSSFITESSTVSSGFQRKYTSELPRCWCLPHSPVYPSSL